MLKALIKLLSRIAHLSPVGVSALSSRDFHPVNMIEESLSRSISLYFFYPLIDFLKIAFIGLIFETRQCGNLLITVLTIRFKQVC